MEKFIGKENRNEMPPKVLLMYRAVMDLMEEGEEIADMKVSTITDKAGIGKGTAYEYFTSKDDIVAGAVVHHMQTIFQCISAELLQKKTLEEQIDFLLDEVEKTKGQKVCFFRFAHLLTDQSGFSEMIRERITATDMVSLLPACFLNRMIQDAFARGEIKADTSADYLTCFLMAQMMNYTLFFAMEGEAFTVSPEEMRKNIKQSIRNELKLI